jgi:hypothetical protein
MGCASLPEKETVQIVEESVPVEQKNVTVEEKKNGIPTEKEQSFIQEEIALVMKEYSYYPDGSIDTYTKYSYTQNTAHLVREEVYDANDRLIEQIEYEYSDDLLLNKKEYDGKGNLRSHRKFSYKDGFVIANVLYDGRGIKKNESKYEYDNLGQRVKWSIYDETDTLLAYTGYQYDGGNNIRVEFYSPSGFLEKYSEIEYLGDSLKIKESFYTQDNKLEKYILYEYENNNLVSEQYLTASDKLIRSVKYENDDKGNPIKMLYYDSKSNLKEIIERVYLYQTVKRLLKE